MKFFFTIFLFFPLVLTAELKEEIFNDLARSVECGDFENSLNLTEYWDTSFPEDTIHAKACTSLFLLMNGKEKEALKIFHSIEGNLNYHLSPEMAESYLTIFHSFLSDEEQFLLQDLYNFSTDPYSCKFRGWKIKSVFGAILFTAGLVVAPFNPGAGRTIMLTAAGLMFDGTLSSMDEDEDRKKEPTSKKDCAIERKNDLYSFAVAY